MGGSGGAGTPVVALCFAVRMRGALTRTLLAVAVAGLAADASAWAQAPRVTTGQAQIGPAGAFDPAKPGFNALRTVAGQRLFLREIGRARAQPGRTKRRTSLIYLAQVNDLQLADEESPARIDSLAPVQPNTSAWRPQEALMPQTIDATFRRLNAFTAASPNRGANGQRAAMSLALMGGDQADNQQENETLWTRQLMEGGQTAGPQQRRRRHVGLHATAARRPGRPPGRGSALHRSAGLRRLQRRRAQRQLLRPRPARGQVRVLAGIRGADGRRPATLRARGPAARSRAAAHLRHEREPRRGRPGLRLGHPVRQPRGHRLLQALRAQPQQGDVARRGDRLLQRLHGATRSAPAVRGPRRHQADLRRREPARRARLRVRGRRPERRLGRQRVVLRLDAEAGPALHLAGHRLRGHRQRRWRGGQPR